MPPLQNALHDSAKRAYAAQFRRSYGRAITPGELRDRAHWTTADLESNTASLKDDEGMSRLRCEA